MTPDSNHEDKCSGTRLQNVLNGHYVAAAKLGHTIMRYPSVYRVQLSQIIVKSVRRERLNSASASGP